MAGKKKDADIVLNSDAGHDFEEEDFVLNFKPHIEWVEPDEEYLDGDLPVEGPSLDEARNRTTALLNGYKKVESLIDEVEVRVDKRVKDTGGLDVVLDPTSDAPTIAAIKRRFPDKDSGTITYDMYKQALKCLAKQAPAVPEVTGADVRAAKADPVRTDFGGYGSKPGELRAEINNPAAMKPVDLQKFQDQAVTALFKKMESLIVGAAKGEVQTHEKKMPHH